MSYRPQHQPRDTKIDEAKPRIMRIFEQYPKQVFCSTQIETMLEREFFHWITNKALEKLAAERQIQQMRRPFRETRSTFSRTSSTATGNASKRPSRFSWSAFSIQTSQRRSDEPQR